MVFTNWGPYFWGVLHIATLTAPQQLTDAHRDGFRQLINSYLQVLPCPVCQKHFEETLSKFPIEERMESSTELFLWTVDVHNEVNRNLKKPTVSYAEAVAYWGPKCKYLPTETETKFPYEIAASIAIAILVVAVIKFKI
jgi:hypothetical protein